MTTRERAKPKKAFLFNEQLAKGERGEHFFLHHYHSPIIKYRWHTADFIDWEGSKIELKTDFYSLQDTEFMFMERYSDVDKRKPGGPWQSHKNGVDKFVYLFIRDGVYFEFENMEKLLARLKKLTDKAPMVYIKNPTYRAGGYKVRIADLEDICHRHRLYWSLDEV